MITLLCERCGHRPAAVADSDAGEVCDICLRELWLATVHREPEPEPVP